VEEESLDVPSARPVGRQASIIVSTHAHGQDHAPTHSSKWGTCPLHILQLQTFAPGAMPYFSPPLTSAPELRAQHSVSNFVGRV
jgi:hypothetical protein